MSVEFNHTIVQATDKGASAQFLAAILGVDVGPVWGHFVPLGMTNGVSIDFLDVSGAITPQHYAFLVSEDDFDACHARLLDDRVQLWGDPGQSRPGEINHLYGGRGVYFEDPDGHLMEIITRPYGPVPEFMPRRTA